MGRACSTHGDLRMHTVFVGNPKVKGPTQPPIQWDRGSFLGGRSAWGVQLTTRLDVVPRLRMRGAVAPLPHTSAWRGA
jgi:hypothetical protein